MPPRSWQLAVVGAVQRVSLRARSIARAEGCWKVNTKQFPVLILGLGRSGSKLVRQILNHNDEVYIGPELNLYSVCKDSLLKHIHEIGDLKEDVNIEEILELVYSQKIQKTHSFTEPIPREQLRSLLLKGERTPKGVFDSLIRGRAEVKKRNARVVGVKFPFHFSFTKNVLEWYPEAKIIFLLRDPRAILASELKKKAEGRSVSTSFPKFRSAMVLKAAVLLYVLISVYWYSRVIGRYRNMRNVYLLKYENLILEPEGAIRDLCDFLDIAYDEEMKNVSLRDSSFDRKQSDGFRVEPLKKWEQELGRGQKLLLQSLLGDFLSDYGYQ